MSNRLPFADAIKLKNSNNDFFQAQAAEILATKMSLRPEAVYDWANKHDVDLVKSGANLANYTKLYCTILNDTIEGLVITPNGAHVPQFKVSL